MSRRGRDPDDDGRIDPVDGAVVDRADYDPGYDPSAPIPCEVCGGEMHYTASCRIRCRRCGYTRDCSDP